MESRESCQGPAVELELLPGPDALRTIELPSGVSVKIFEEGDGTTFPKSSVEAHLVGRLPSGCVFESTAGKGQPPMRMELGRCGIIEGMELGLRELSLGALAELRIPSRLGYKHVGVPKMVPPNSDLIFQVDLVAVDGTKASFCRGGASEPRSIASDAVAVVDDSADGGASGRRRTLRCPWWVSRVERPEPTRFYLNFCAHMARDMPAHVLERAVPVPRKTRKEVAGWDLSGSPAVVSGLQEGWKAQKWDLEWFKDQLGSRRQLVKWQGPVFTTRESLWDCPVWETSLSEYIDYVRAVDSVDPGCAAANAVPCPRLYLNGWPAFKQLPWLREHLINPTMFDDFTGELIAENDELRELFLAGLSKGYQAPPNEERQRQIDDEYWELTKVFISPKGALSRLHFDNGGAHVWLSQVRGRKLFVCFAPSDGEHLHPFEGDEGLLNSSWIDPLDPEVESKWPGYAKATPYVAVVEEGETIVAPQGWWHYAVALDTSVTIMRNFYSKTNKHEMIRRKDAVLENALAMHVLKAKIKNQPDEVLKEIAKKAVLKIREGLQERSEPPALTPSPGGPKQRAARSGGFSAVVAARR